MSTNDSQNGVRSEIRGFLSGFFSKEVLHPSQWSWRIFVGATIFLLSLNLFGERGLIHGVIITQEERRLESELLRAKHELVAINREIDRFRNSDVEKFRAIREELGFLRSNEVSVEFLGPDAINARAEAPVVTKP